MPHPERASDPLLGSTDGLVLLAALLGAAGGRPSRCDDDPAATPGAGATAAPQPRPDRRRGRLHRAAPGPPGQPPRAGHVRGDVERALLLQVLPPSICGGSPRRAPRSWSAPGENAGVIDAGDGIAVAIRIESHNHPSAIEPYQGAATGVGGIIRDIFTMGARPVAAHGPAAFRAARRRPQPVDRHRRGDAGFPVTATPSASHRRRRAGFDHCYAGNPLVNVLCCGLLPEGPAGVRPGRRRRQPGCAAWLDHRPRRDRRRQRAGLGRLSPTTPTPKPPSGPTCRWATRSRRSA